MLPNGLSKIVKATMMLPGTYVESTARLDPTVVGASQGPPVCIILSHAFQGVAHIAGYLPTCLLNIHQGRIYECYFGSSSKLSLVVLTTSKVYRYFDAGSMHSTRIKTVKSLMEKKYNYGLAESVN